MDWKEPLWGASLSAVVVTGDLLVGAFELPRTHAYEFVLAAVRQDVLRLTILVLGPSIGLVLRHFRIKREQLFRDLVATIVHIIDHEIRNPLMMILGASSLMKQSDPEDARRLRQVGQGVDRIVEAVSNLGSMAHITTSRFYDIRDHLKASTNPARDLKRWASHTVVIEHPRKAPGAGKPAPEPPAEQDRG